MCKAFEVSRSGYYAFAGRPESTRCQANRELLKTIRQIFERNHKIYGAPQITKNLPSHQQASRGRVARLMRAHGIRSKVARKFKATTNSRHNLPVADNLLNREFASTAPNQKWVSDISVPQKAA
jgi:transposase InsO family protein